MPNWTDSQKRAIEERGANLLISAAAGSGKTAVMVLPIAAVVHNYLLTASVIFIS